MPNEVTQGRVRAAKGRASDYITREAVDAVDWEDVLRAAMEAPPEQFGEDFVDQLKKDSELLEGLATGHSGLMVATEKQRRKYAEAFQIARIAQDINTAALLLNQQNEEIERLSAHPAPVGELGELVERLSSHGGQQDPQILVDDCGKAAQALTAMQAQRDEARYDGAMQEGIHCWNIAISYNATKGDFSEEHRRGQDYAAGQIAKAIDSRKSKAALAEGGGA